MFEYDLKVKLGVEFVGVCVTVMKPPVIELEAPTLLRLTGWVTNGVAPGPITAPAVGHVAVSAVSEWTGRFPDTICVGLQTKSSAANPLGAPPRGDGL